jgi:chromosomal replication initiation ATPase DnaA
MPNPNRLAAYRIGDEADLQTLVVRMMLKLQQHDELLDKMAEFFTANRPTLEEIMTCVAEFYDIPRLAIVGHSHIHKFAHPRLVTYYLARKLTRLSLPNIAARLDHRDHGTVYSGFQRIAQRVRKDEILRDDLDVLRSRIAEKVLARQPPRSMSS